MSSVLAPRSKLFKNVGNRSLRDPAMSCARCHTSSKVAKKEDGRNTTERNDTLSLGFGGGKGECRSSPGAGERPQ